MNEYVEILVRSIAAFFYLILLSRIVGPRQISQLTFYDYIVGITIGSIAGTMCLDRDIPVYYSLIAIAVFSILLFLTAKLTSKSIIGRRIFTGSPKVLIDNGKIIEKSLKRVSYDINDLEREVRTQGYFNIGDVAYAVLETNGQLSIMPKVDKRPLEVADMDKKLSQDSMVANVIIDGKIMEKNLKCIGKNKQWVQDELAKQGNTNINDILLATVDANHELVTYLKGETTERNTMWE